MNENSQVPRAPFSKRAVAFLDILGFKEIIKEAEKADSQKLRRLRSLLDTYIHFDPQRSPGVPADAKPSYLFISDSIILSAPLAYNDYDGLAIVIMKSIEVAQMLLNDGYLVRGAIEVGAVWHENSNIFGSAYITAYQREESEPHPRIVLCQNARQHWSQVAQNLDVNLCVENDGEVIVDILNPHYLHDKTFKYFEQAYEQFVVWTIRRLEELPPGSARSKWEWMALAINRAIEKFGLQIKPFDKFPLPL
jgi:hypothetical protein